MTASTTNSFADAARIDEPRASEDFSNALSKVATDGQPIIVQRNGEDLAAVITVEQLETLQLALAAREAERLASEIDWNDYLAKHRPPQAWFDGEEPKPF